MLEIFSDWKNAKSNRSVQFVTGTAYISAAGESLLRNIHSGKTIRQIALGPMTGVAHGGLPEKEMSFGSNGKSRIPLYRTFYRNYVLNIKRSEKSAISGRLVPTNVIETAIITEDSVANGDFDKKVDKASKTIEYQNGGGTLYRLTVIVRGEA